MLLFAPEGYEDFVCLKGSCRHTCCAHWEIDVDEASLARYEAVPGPFGETLRRCLGLEDGTAHFILDEQERCPLLRPDGLCELICRQGQDALCQVCADHPRYRSFFSTRTEIGLGLCCEASARLALSRRAPFALQILSGDEEAAREEAEMAEEEIALLLFRDELMETVQAREVPILSRIEQIAARCGASWPQDDIASCATFLLGLEQMDADWTRRLHHLREAAPRLAARRLAPWALPLEQLMAHLLYRHLPEALDDGDPAGHALVCCAIWQAAAALFLLEKEQTLDSLCEVVRLCSSEIEYDQDNMDALLARCQALSDSDVSPS